MPTSTLQAPQEKAPASLATLWQLPLAFVGILLFGWGMRLYIESRRPPPFAQQAAGLQSLLSHGMDNQAIGQINAVRRYYPKPAEQSQFEAFLARAYFDGQQKQAGFVAANYRRTIAHYSAAARLGYRQTPAAAGRWGLAGVALKDWTTAERHLPLAIHTATERMALTRPLVAAYLGDRPARYGDARRAVAALLRIKPLPTRLHVWALCKEIMLALHRPGFPGLAPLLTQAEALGHKPLPRELAAKLYLALGRAQLQQGHERQARLTLAAADKAFISNGPDDARARILLADIAQDQGQLQLAGRLYQGVLVNDAGGTLTAAAHLGEAQVLAALGHPGKAMRAHYRKAINALLARGRYHRRPEFITRLNVVASLQKGFGQYSIARRYGAALAFLRLLRLLRVPPTAAYAWQEAVTQQRRAAQLKKQAAAAALPARQALLQRVLEHCARAAAAYRLAARLTAVSAVARSRTSMWRAAELADRAALPRHAIDAYRHYVNNWPASPRVPQALYRIGLLYASLGRYTRAVHYFVRDIHSFPQAPAAYRSYAQAARAEMAQNPPQYQAARKLLLALLQGNPNISPRAREFRQGLFLLGRVDYRLGQYSSAILRLREALQRYPEDPRTILATFYLAQSYQHSALAIGKLLKKTPTLENRQRFVAARQHRLARAARLFGQCIARAAAARKLAHAPGARPANPRRAALERRAVRYSYLYRANCLYEGGHYAAALAAYNRAASEHPQTRTALQASVQLVACRLALHQPRRARFAAARARWLLRHMPPKAFIGHRRGGRKFFRQLLAVAGENP